MWPFTSTRGHRIIAHAITEGFQLMADKFTDLIAAFNDGTNAVAARIDRLIAALGNNATDEQIAEMTALSTHLKELGQDPANPVPTPPTIG